MVVTERENEILLFEQHEHARVCGEFAKQWRDDYFSGHDNRKSVTYAIFEHDNGWIELDQQPLLNKETLLPYSFIDYPLKPKLAAYTNCINRVEKEDDYAALICSLHYTSFFEGYANGRGAEFITQERLRQEKLRRRLKINKESLLFHYNLLQFCDNLSLYLCLNEPGVDKENEFFWFREGFSQTFSYNSQKRLMAKWLNKDTVSLSDFPFKEEITVTLNYKAIPKKRICHLQEEYDTKAMQQRIVKLVKGK
ncbi:MAG: DUF3891 family protein [Anaerobacillus sp.]|uniref:DUF3891 family protein n=1 Tax=Anaerobacillus sp. TaxID=1872506 RepID=UPI00391C7EB0